MTDEKPRQPAGRPAGGQFAERPRDDSAVELSAAHSGPVTDTTNSAPLTDAELSEGPLVRMNLQSTANSPMHFTIDAGRGNFDLDPPYQRGAVWDTPRRQRLIRSLLLGIPTGAIILNDRQNWPGIMASGAPMYGVIDGKQRILALRAWEDGGFSIPSAWIDPADLPDGAGSFVTFPELSLPWRRKWIMRPIAAYQASVKTIEEEAEVFRLVNTGGVDQTDADLARAAGVEQRP